jgi:periplasmic protein TonB
LWPKFFFATAAHSIARSSGYGPLDAEVREMMAEAHPPPPPGGHFRASISFNLGQRSSV